MPTIPCSEFPPARLWVGCKINLYLEITGRLDNGFHSIESLFYYLPEPHDLLEITPGRPGRGLQLSCPGQPGLNGEDNILAKTYRRFAQATGRRYDLDIRLDKGIPMGAGLGGGSSDAAALLTWLNNREKLLAEPELLALAAGLGADVPFFMRTAHAAGRLPQTPQDLPDIRLAWACGIGENLRLLPGETLRDLHLLLVFPEVSISTPWAYAAWDKMPPAPPFFAADFSPEHLTSRIAEDKKPLAHALRLYNGFEAVVFPGFPALGRIKERLISDGAHAALMSGSGSTVFGLFRNAALAQQSARRFSGDSFNCLLQQV